MGTPIVLPRDALPAILKRLLDQKVVVKIGEQPLITQNPQGHGAAMATLEPHETAIEIAR